MTNKNLVVFYSYEGNTRLIAQTIARVIEADVLECKPVKDISQKNFTKYIWGGRQVITKKKPKLESLGKNPQDYEVILIGTPVWVYTYAPAIRSLLSQVTLQKKNIGVFCCHEGGKGNTLEHLKKALVGNTIIGEHDFFNVMKNKEENIEKAKKWAATLQQG